MKIEVPVEKWNGIHIERQTESELKDFEFLLLYLEVRKYMSGMFRFTSEVVL